MKFSVYFVAILIVSPIVHANEISAYHCEQYSNGVITSVQVDIASGPDNRPLPQGIFPITIERSTPGGQMGICVGRKYPGFFCESFRGSLYPGPQTKQMSYVSNAHEVNFIIDTSNFSETQNPPGSGGESKNSGLGVLNWPAKGFVNAKLPCKARYLYRSRH